MPRIRTWMEDCADRETAAQIIDTIYSEVEADIGEPIGNNEGVGIYAMVCDRCHQITCGESIIADNPDYVADIEAANIAPVALGGVPVRISLESPPLDSITRGDSEMDNTGEVKKLVKKNILKMRIESKANSLKVFVQSDALEDFFYTQQMGRTERAYDMGPDARIYHSNILRDIESIGGGCVVTYCAPNLYYDNRPNLSWIRLVGLRNGITFDAGSLVSKKMVEDYRNSVKTFMREFAANYLSSYKTELNVSSWE